MRSPSICCQSACRAGRCSAGWCTSTPSALSTMRRHARRPSPRYRDRRRRPRGRPPRPSTTTWAVGARRALPPGRSTRALARERPRLRDRQRGRRPRSPARAARSSSAPSAAGGRPRRPARRCRRNPSGPLPPRTVGGAGRPAAGDVLGHWAVELGTAQLQQVGAVGTACGRPARQVDVRHHDRLALAGRHGHHRAVGGHDLALPRSGERRPGRLHGAGELRPAAPRAAADPPCSTPRSTRRSRRRAPARAARPRPAAKELRLLQQDLRPADGEAPCRLGDHAVHAAVEADAAQRGVDHRRMAASPPLRWMRSAPMSTCLSVWATEPVVGENSSWVMVIRGGRVPGRRRPRARWRWRPPRRRGRGGIGQRRPRTASRRVGDVDGHAPRRARRTRRPRGGCRTRAARPAPRPRRRPAPIIRTRVAMFSVDVGADLALGRGDAHRGPLRSRPPVIRARQAPDAGEVARLGQQARVPWSSDSSIHGTDGDEGVQVHAGVVAHPLQQVDEVLGGDVAGGVGSEGATADAGHGGVEHPRRRPPPRRRRWPARCCGCCGSGTAVTASPITGRHRGDPLPHVGRHGHTDRVGERDLVGTVLGHPRHHVDQPLTRAPRPRRGSRSWRPGSPRWPGPASRAAPRCRPRRR